MWRFGGFLSVGIDKPSDMSCGFAMSLFRNSRNYAEEKIFVLDIWIPFLTVRFELRKDWPGEPIKGGEWYWEPGYGPGKMIEARHEQAKGATNGSGMDSSVVVCSAHTSHIL